MHIRRDAAAIAVGDLVINPSSGLQDRVRVAGKVPNTLCGGGAMCAKRMTKGCGSDAYKILFRDGPPVSCCAGYEFEIRR